MALVPTSDFNYSTPTYVNSSIAFNNISTKTISSSLIYSSKWQFSSDGNNNFDSNYNILQDTFADGDYTNNPTWTITAGTRTFAVGNTHLYQIFGGGGGYPDLCSPFIINDLNGKIISLSFSAKFAVDTSVQLAAVGIGNGNGATSYSLGTYGASEPNVIRFSKDIGQGSASVLLSISTPVLDGVEHYYYAERGKDYNWVIYKDSSLIGSVVDASYSSFTDAEISLLGSGDSTNNWIDNIKIQTSDSNWSSNISHSFNAPGIKTVFLTVGNTDGNNTISKDLNILAGLDLNVVNPRSGNYYGFQNTNKDENHSIDFNVIAQSGNSPRLRIYKSTIANKFQNLLYDLNLEKAAISPTADFNCGTANASFATTRTCHVDWNLSDVFTGDGNFFFDFNLSLYGFDFNFVKSSSSFVIDTNKPSTSWDGNNNVWQRTDANIHLTCNDLFGCGARNVLLFDNFEDNDLLNPTWAILDDFAEVQSAVVKNGLYSLKCTVQCFITTPMVGPANTFSTWIQGEDGVSYFSRFGSESMRFNLNNPHGEITYGGGTSFSPVIPYIGQKWYFLKIVSAPGSLTAKYYVYDSDGTTLLGSAIQTLPSRPNYVALSTSTGTTYFDDVVYGAYTSANPIVYLRDIDRSSSTLMGIYQLYDKNIFIKNSGVDGNYKIDFDSVDFAGNNSDINEQYILLDNTVPIVSNNSPAGDINQASQIFTWVFDIFDGNGSYANSCDYNAYLNDALIITLENRHGNLNVDGTLCTISFLYDAPTSQYIDININVIDKVNLRSNTIKSAKFSYIPGGGEPPVLPGGGPGGGGSGPVEPDKNILTSSLLQLIPNTSILQLYKTSSKQYYITAVSSSDQIIPIKIIIPAKMRPYLKSVIENDSLNPNETKVYRFVGQNVLDENFSPVIDDIIFNLNNGQLEIPVRLTIEQTSAEDVLDIFSMTLGDTKIPIVIAAGVAVLLWLVYARLK